MSIMSNAATLRLVAGLIEDGLPEPISITLSPYRQPYLQVFAEGLPAWLVTLEVVMPTWVEGHAEWEPGTFDGHPFALSCYDSSLVKASA